MSKNNNVAFTNIAFILLIVLLLISAFKAQPAAFDLAGIFDNDFSGVPSVSTASQPKKEEVKTPESNVVVNDFEKLKAPKVNRTITKSTAMSYTKTRTLSGTEMLELAKMKKFSDCMLQNKKLVVYVNKGSDADIQAFIKEFSKTKDKYRNNSSYMFVTLDSLWDVNEEAIKNTHDRVIYNIKKDCGLFCIFDFRGEKLIKLKGTMVSKKGAEIVDVILNSL